MTLEEKELQLKLAKQGLLEAGESRNEIVGDDTAVMVVSYRKELVGSSHAGDKELMKGVYRRMIQ